MNIQQIGHPTLPIGAVINLNKQVVLIPIAKFKTYIDDSGGFISMFDNDGFTINNVEYDYGVWYNVNSDLEIWLKAQKFDIGRKYGL